MNYVVIMPAYNETEYIGRTLASLCSQQLLPTLLVVVDDGSSDTTAEVVQGYADKYSWIRLVQKEKSVRAVGSKVVLAFNAGYEALSAELDYDFIVKLDADLELPPDYFSRVAAMFEQYPNVGICGGYCVIPEGEDWVREKTALMHIRGAFKSIRRTAFEQIGGFQPVMGWDGIDQIKLLSKGWKIGLIDSPVKHFRPTGKASDSRKLYGNWGRAAYLRGYDFGLTFLAAFSTACRTKHPLNFVYYLSGFVLATIEREPRLLNQDEIYFVRKLQYRRLFSAKKILAEYAQHE